MTSIMVGRSLALMESIFVIRSFTGLEYVARMDG